MMSVLERVTNGQDIVDRTNGRHWPVGEHRRQRLSIEVFHHDGAGAFVVPHVDHADDVRMTKRAHGTRLVPEPLSMTSTRELDGLDRDFERSGENTSELQ